LYEPGKCDSLVDVRGLRFVRIVGRSPDEEVVSRGSGTNSTLRC
jgi:hypothetical protein